MKKKHITSLVSIRERRIRVKQVILAICLLVVAAIAVVAWRIYSTPPSVDASAASVLAKCQKSAYRPACYENEIPKLMNRLTMEQTFAVTKIVQDQDSQFAYCHVVAHKLSFEEAKKNPNAWKNVLLRCPIAMCNYGCLHGSLIQHFRSDDFSDAQIDSAIADLQNVCEPRRGFAPSEIDRTMCYHALGHIAMYMTKGKPDKSAAICERLAVKPDGRNYLETCVEGAFMTVFQGVDPEDLALVKTIKPTKEHVPQFCSLYGSYWSACRHEAYPLFRQDLRNPQGLVDYCSYATGDTMRQNCTFVVMNDVVVNLLSLPDVASLIRDYCKAVPGQYTADCFSGSAMRMVQIDPMRYADIAVNVCKNAQDFGVGDRCYDGLLYYAGFSFPVGSQNYISYCNHLPDQTRATCITGKKQ